MAQTARYGRPDPAFRDKETTVNPVLLATASNTVVCCQNEDENAKVGVRL